MSFHTKEKQIFDIIRQIYKKHRDLADYNQSIISNLSLNIFCSVRERPIEVANFDQEDMDSFTSLMIELATLEEII